MSTISIITTTYKHQDFIERTIESILSQSFTDWELLIGDDSPDENTWSVIQGYVQKYPDKIRAWHHSPNKGIVENMNFLISQVALESEYLAFLEGDDMWTYDCLMKKMNVFEQYPEVAFVYSDLSFINALDEVILKSFFEKRKVQLVQNKQLTPEEYISYEAGPVASYSTGMVRKSVFQKAGIYSQCPEDKTYSVSDYDFYFQISTQFPIYGLEESLTLYRRHSGNLSAQNIKLFTDLEKLISIYFQTNKISDGSYIKKKSFIDILSAIAFLSENKKQLAYKKWQDSFGAPFSYCFYKISIGILMCFPCFLRSKILKTQIIR